MPQVPKTPKAHAPIFRRHAQLVMPDADLPLKRGPDQALVTPLGIFVAQRGSFFAVVRDRATPSLALELLFRELPLEAFGWNFGTTLITRSGTSSDGFPVWRATLDWMPRPNGGV